MDSIGEGTKSFINCSYPLAGSSVYMSNMAIRDIKFSCIWWWWKGGMEIITKSIEVELD